MKILQTSTAKLADEVVFHPKGHRVVVELDDGTRFELTEYVMDGRECLRVRTTNDVLGIVPSATNMIYLQQRKW